MAETKYGEDSNRFDCIGIDLNRPVDSLKSGKFSWLKNMRSYQAGTVQPREGLTLVDDLASQTPAHSMRRLNDPANATFAFIVGAGTHLGYGTTSFTDADSGYSGDPLALIPWRPQASPKPFMYVADRSRMRKISTAGALDAIGYAPPTATPGVGLTTAPSYKVLDTFQATTGWAATGTAAAPSTTTRVSTTIARIIFDVSTTGWATINPTSTDGIGPGGRLIINSGGGTVETVTVQSVTPPSTATTIGSIIYDSGTSGLCSIVFATPVIQAISDGFLRNTTIGENVRILSATLGPQGLTSVRVSTSGTFAATNAVQILGSFRAYCVSTHAAAETLTELALRSAITNGTGTLTKTAALDLSIIATGVPATPSDLMHITLRVSDPTVVTEIKAEVDVDNTTNDFAHNFLYYAFRPSDLTGNVANLQSLVDAKNAIIQKQIADATKYQGFLRPLIDAGVAQQLAAQQFDSNTGTFSPGINSDQPIFSSTAPHGFVSTTTTGEQLSSKQLDPGSAQFVELVIPLGDLIRVGSDKSRTLANVAAIRLAIQATGSFNFDVDSWWIGGGYGPSTVPVEATPYYYRYRVRNPATNVASNFSPPSRYDALPLRQSVTVTPTQYAAPSGTSLSTSDFVIDIERFGGTIPEWRYVGTVANGSSPTFADIYPDDTVSGNPQHGNTNYQPWPILGLPVTGTTGTVAGTTLNDSSTTFNTSWAMGTRILVNNQPYTIYRVISTSRIETFENMGSQSSVVWRIDEPTILAQPLPCLWEWEGTLFACGDTVNAGRLYYTNPNSESTVPNNYLDLTAPSEPLMNGLQFNVRSFLFSSENMFQILSTGNPDNRFTGQQIPNGKGMFSRWGLTREPSPIIAFLSKDGIYATQGGTPISLTDADLYPLFPNEGNPGTTITLREDVVIEAPDMTAANAAALRMAYNSEYLYFDYPPIGDSSIRRTLLMAFDAGAYARGEAPGGWFWDVFTPSVVFHYGEEGPGTMRLFVGGANGSFYQYTVGTDDAGEAITFGLLTAARDQGDPRSRKLYGDVMLDSDTGGLDITATPLVNNHVTALTATTYSTSTRQQTILPTETPWTSARNVSLLIGGSIGGVLAITSFCPTSPITLDVPYTVTLSATGGAPPYSWTVTAGSLPTGLTLDPDTGIISGTPTVADDFSWSITVTDTAANTDTLSCTTTVAASTLAIVQCPTGDEPTVGVPYSFTLEATGGQAPYTWAITSGSLPDGLTLNASTGEIAGTPTEFGSFSWTATVTDSLTSTGHIDCGFDITADITIRPTAYTNSPVPSVYPVPANTRVCFVSPNIDPATAFDADEATYFTLLISGGTGVSTFGMVHFYDFSPIPADLTGLVSVDFYIRMRITVDGNSPNAVYGEVFDGIDTNDVHHPGSNPATIFGISGPVTADWTDYSSPFGTMPAADFIALASPTVRVFPKSATGELGTPYPLFDFAEVWAVMHFA